MKLVTHFVFTTGLLTLLSTPFLGFFSSLILSSLLSSFSNSLIDGLGHEVRGGFVRRTPRTHTVPRSMIWGVIPSLPFLILFRDPLFLALGLLTGPSHMLLDVFTERGIYVRRDGRWRRFALAHFSYGNPLANGLAVTVGALMLFTALGGSHYNCYYLQSNW